MHTHATSTSRPTTGELSTVEHDRLTELDSRFLDPSLADRAQADPHQTHGRSRSEQACSCSPATENLTALTLCVDDHRIIAVEIRDHELNGILHRARGSPAQPRPEYRC